MSPASMLQSFQRSLVHMQLLCPQCQAHELSAAPVKLKWRRSCLQFPHKMSSLGTKQKVHIDNGSEGRSNFLYIKDIQARENHYQIPKCKSKHQTHLVRNVSPKPPLGPTIASRPLRGHPRHSWNIHIPEQVPRLAPSRGAHCASGLSTLGVLQKSILHCPSLPQPAHRAQLRFSLHQPFL